MNNADQSLEEVLAQIREREVPAFPRAAISEKLDAVQKGGIRNSKVVGASSWRRRWQLLTAGALAAGILVGAFWLLSAVESNQALAFAEVQQAVAAKQTVRFRILHYSDDPNYLQQYNVKAGEPTISQLVYSGNRIRSEQPLGMVSITDYDKGASMFIWHHSQRAVISPIYGTELQKKSLDFRTKLRNVPESGAKKLPDRELNGRTVSEFVLRIGDQDFTVTVDPRSKLPIRMEVVRQKQPEKGQGAIREVYTDFVFDAQVDDSLFRMEAPAGYQVVNRIPRNDQPQPPANMTLVVSPDDGIGPVKFGAKVADIVMLLGEPDWRDDEEDAGPVPFPGAEPHPKAVKQMRTELGYDRRGFRLMANDKSGLYSIRCFNKHGGAPTEVGFRGKTKEGIALDASLEDVLKVYGKPDAQLDSHYVFYPKRGYEFMFRDKKLVSIRVGRPHPNAQIEVRGNQIIERATAPK
jgi:outer membrane lipoprotein-sorting protein